MLCISQICFTISIIVKELVELSITLLVVFDSSFPQISLPTIVKQPSSKVTASVAVIVSLFIIKPRKKDWTHHEGKPQNDVSNEFFMIFCVSSNFEKSETPYKQRIT